VAHWEEDSAAVAAGAWGAVEVAGVAAGWVAGWVVHQTK
jgi:hypothetical protein